jgi:putative protease
MEILSPAGSPEALRAAVLSGADAVYMGASGFNARRNAKNFSDDELRRSVLFCHERGVSVYITLNTLVYDREIPEALKLAEFLTEIGVDAFIVQDLGLASLLKKCSPSVRLHASTQMSVCSLDGVETLADLGFSRVVLARELSAADIAYIAARSPIETEFFVHGAFCMSYSGQCYMSSIIGGRSGNRGMCAQPCRLPYRNGYALSLKDNCLLEYVPELRKAGVTSLKIEGRMKGPEYVSAVTDMYVRAKNGEEYTEKKKEYLADVFSRQGFTDGYYTNKTGEKMFGVRPENAEQIKVELPKDEFKRFPVDFSFVSNGKTATVSATCRDGYSCSVQTEVSKAEKRPTTAEDIFSALSKLGGTPYFAGNFSCETGENDFISVASLNAARRELIKNLTEMRITKNQSFTFKKTDRYVFSPAEKTMIEAFFLDPASVPENTDDLLLIWLPSEFFTRKNSEKLVLKYGDKTGIALPSVFHDSERATVLKQLEAAKNAGVKHALCGNIGHIRLAAQYGFTVHGDYGLNIVNSESVKEYSALGAEYKTLSFELSMRRAGDLCGKDTGIIAYGRLPFMIMKNCLKGGSGSICARKGKTAVLTDRMKKDFLLTCDFGCRNRLWNSDILWLADKQLPPFGFIRLIFTDETPQQAQRVIEAYSGISSPPPVNMTRGRYYS